MSGSAVDRRIRSLRPPKPYVDPLVAHGSLVEEERRPGGRVERALTAFLSGAECPFTCAFCDLWQYTIDGPTPRGALVTQLESVLAAVEQPVPERLKLYNASNFFDARAVPVADVPALAALASPFAAVTVESHVNTIGERTLEFARMIEGRLEVAVGLETIDPVAAEQLNKRLDLGRFDRAAGLLADNDIDLRVFVLLGAPHVAREDAVDSAVCAAVYAVERGAAMVSIIPVRGGNGELERLAALGRFHPPTLRQLEEALERCVSMGPGVVTVDLWDAERLPACEACRVARVERLRRINVSGKAEPGISCEACGAA